MKNPKMITTFGFCSDVPRSENIFGLFWRGGRREAPISMRAKKKK
jgi:hypothetical protein